MWRAVIIAAALLGCIQSGRAQDEQKAVSPELPQYEAEVVIIDENPHSVIIPRVLWDFGTYTAGTIPVCWESFEPQYEEERGWVRAAVTDTWQRNSGLAFGGWGRCPTTTPFQGIRIEVVDDEDSPRVDYFGMALKGRRNGMELNFEFPIFQANCCRRIGSWPFEDCTLEEHRENCIRATAIHEFGHAIGFAHEQRHPDTPDSCEFRESLGAREVVVTARYDPLSVMNYCRPDRMHALRLSTYDVRTLQALYCTPGVRTCGGYSVGLRID